MMTFGVRLKKARKSTQPRLRFDLEKLRDLYVAFTFQAITGRKFAALVGLKNDKDSTYRHTDTAGLRDEDMDISTMITSCNTAVTDAASEILGKERRRKKPWVTRNVLDLCDERRDWKNRRYEV